MSESTFPRNANNIGEFIRTRKLDITPLVLKSGCFSRIEGFRKNSIYQMPELPDYVFLEYSQYACTKRFETHFVVIDKEELTEVAKYEWTEVSQGYLNRHTQFSDYLHRHIAGIKLGDKESEAHHEGPLFVNTTSAIRIVTSEQHQKIHKRPREIQRGTESLERFTICDRDSLESFTDFFLEYIEKPQYYGDLLSI